MPAAIIDHKNDGATDVFLAESVRLRVGRGGIRRSVDPGEIGNFSRLTVLQDLKVSGLKIADVVSFRIGDDGIHLDEIDRDAKRWLAGGLRMRLEDQQRGGGKKDEPKRWWPGRDDGSMLSQRFKPDRA